VHPVWAPIRNSEHEALPGVVVGDIGPKAGYTTKDNGFLAFSHYRVPVDNLLGRFIKISPEGKVTRLGNPKIVYSSMMLTRSYLCYIWPRFAGIALTIAVRYSLVRTQFMNT
jgi:acyl-CoA oxidase